MSNTSIMLDSALRYAREGFPVHPLNGKIPRTRNGFYDATTDEETIRRWWSMWPDADIGITTGNGLVVVDVDPRNGGIESLRHLWDRYGDFPITRVVRTGGGGFHYYFSAPDDLHSRKLAGNGVELKAAGGYVVAPPSIHAGTGKAYEWDDDETEIAPLPEWILNITREGEAAHSRVDMASILAGVPEGQRNESLFRAACKLRHADVPEEWALVLALCSAEACSPPFPDSEAIQIVERVYATYAAGPEAPYYGFNSRYTVDDETRPRASSKLILASSVNPVDVAWLWPQRIPLGKLTLLDGDPGLGKSTLMMDIAARVTTGTPMPDGSQADKEGPGAVLLLSAEDGIDDTIVPRVIAARGNRDLLWIWPNDQMPEIPGSVEEIGAYVADFGIRLVIIDPLMAYLAQGVKTNDDHHIRRALVPLSAMAQETGCAVVVLRHLNKRSGETNAIYRGGGSIGISGAARTVMVAAKDPADVTEQRVVLAVTKNNLAPRAPSLTYTVSSTDHGGSAISWGEATDITANQLLAARVSAPRQSALEEAEEFLRSVLADGAASVPHVERAAKGRGIASDTLLRAKRSLDVETINRGFGVNKTYFWALPGPDIDS